MTERISRDSGVIEGASRVLRELMAGRRTRETIRILSTNLDPDNADLLVDALADDPARLIDALSLLPQLANVGIVAAGHALQRLSALPAGIKRDFVAQLIGDLDAERLGAAMGTVDRVAASLIDAEVLRVAARKVEDQITAGFARTSRRGDRRVWVRRLADGIRRFGARHPDLVNELARPIVAAVRDVIDTRDALDGRDVNDGREAIDARDALDVREAIDGRDVNDVRDVIDGRNAVDVREGEEGDAR